MGCYQLYWKMDAGESRTFFQLAIDICKNLKAYNSDVYRYLIAICLFL